MVLEGSHVAIKQRRSLAKSRRRLWCLSDLGTENNLHPADRRTRSGVSASRDNGRRHSNSDLFAYGDPDSNGYAKWYRVAYGNAEWHGKSHGHSKCYRKSDGNTERNSKCYCKSNGDAGRLRSRTRFLEKSPR